MNTSTQHAVERCHARVNAHQLSWLQAGDAAKPVIVFLHGIPASAELWRDVLPLVAAQGFFCLAPDLIGYGDTVMAPGSDYSLNACADLLLSWLKHGGHHAIWLVSHDIGGGVAQLMLTKDESRFARATLSNCITADTWPVSSVKMMRALAKMRAFAPMAALGLFPNFIARHELRRAVVNTGVLTKERTTQIFWDGKVSHKSGRHEFQNMLRALHSRETRQNMQALAQINIPVHLLWAEDDPNQPWAGPGKILAATLRHATVSMIPKAGHFLQIDNPHAYIAGLMQTGL